MQGIFISYRRQDSQSAAGRLADHLREHMSGVPIFRDVETIEPGVDFVEAIGRALQSCGMLQGNQLSLEYVINGYPYQAVLRVSPDGQSMLGQYRGMSTAESGQVQLQRSR